MNTHDFLQFLVENIVDKPKKVKVEENHISENFYHYLIHTDNDDVGKVIGKKGKIIQAIRNVAKILAIKEQKQIRIEVA